MNQRTLIDVPVTPKLTERQSFALAFLRGTGTTGLKPGTLGRLIHIRAGRHGDDRPCDWCASTGLELLRALRAKGVARQRLVEGRMVWQATELPPEMPSGMSDEIPY